MELIFVVDIDGTVCDSRERMKEVLEKYGDEEDWSQKVIDEFLIEDKLMADEIMPGAERLLNVVHRLDARIFFLTGRNERARNLTRAWLQEKMYITDNIPLYMRPIGRKNGTTAKCKEDVFISQILSKWPHATFIFLEDDENTAQRYAKWGMVLKSPECWESIR